MSKPSRNLYEGGVWDEPRPCPRRCLSQARTCPRVCSCQARALSNEVPKASPSLSTRVSQSISSLLQQCVNQTSKLSKINPEGVREGVQKGVQEGVQDGVSQARKLSKGVSKKVFAWARELPVWVSTHASHMSTRLSNPLSKAGRGHVQPNPKA